ncbi:MAG: hypothetical protein GY754_11820 [bacterium]|nr:hypothetical protein [bacterium]
MSSVDYMKVLDIITRTFGADRDVDLKASHEKFDIFDIVMFCSDGRKVPFKMVLNKQFQLDIFFKKIHFESEKEYAKWLSRFEYELEQTFFVNIRIDQADDLQEYHIKVSF